MKTRLLVIGLLLLGFIKLNAQEAKIVKSEAKHYCQCYKTFKKQAKKLERKSKRKEKRDSKPKKYKPGMKPFGGYSLDFNFGDCLNKKRSKKTISYLDALESKEKERFQKKVENAAKKRCPKHNYRFY